MEKQLELIMDEILLTFDGGALKKAGKGFGKGYGSYNIRINGEDKPSFSKLKETYGNELSSNQAEYMAIIKGIEKVIELYGENVKLHIKGDSQLVINQINGIYRVKSPNMVPLYQKAMTLLKNISEYNAEFWVRANSEREFGH